MKQRSPKLQNKHIFLGIILSLAYKTFLLQWKHDLLPEIKAKIGNNPQRHL